MILNDRYPVSMDTNRLKPFIETFWEDSILPSITEYIRIPNKSPAFDPQWVEHGYMEDAVDADGGLGAAAARGLARRHAGGGAPARPHAADLHRGAGRQRRHRAALRPSRQAARNEGLGGGARPVDAGAQGRQALWPRRRRRRLCDLCLPVRAAGAARAEGAARPLRHHDRGLRGIGQLRPALLRRPSAGAHRQAVARRLPRFGLRRLRAAVAHHLAARHRRRARSRCAC